MAGPPALPRYADGNLQSLARYNYGLAMTERGRLIREIDARPPASPARRDLEAQMATLDREIDALAAVALGGVST
jgi:hypothetical protein